MSLLNFDSCQKITLSGWISSVVDSGGVGVGVVCVVDIGDDTIFSSKVKPLRDFFDFCGCSISLSVSYIRHILIHKTNS